MSAAPWPTMPRATLIVLAFNQERYVEAAIAAALAQDYPNLEIILSDDNSSDTTFAVMERAAAAYRGLHRVLTNRTARNAGILSHIYQAVAKASGELIVLAAGDDVSFPHRVTTLVRRWQGSGWMALSSAWIVIDDAGKTLGEGSLSRRALSQAWFAGPAPVPAIAGATGAYDRQVFDAVALPDFPIFAEDFFFALMLGLRSQTVGHVAEPLVGYRVHDQSLTHRDSTTADLTEYECKSERYARQIVELLNYVVSLAETGKGMGHSFGTPRPLALDRLRRDIAHNRLRSEWIEAPPWRRIAGLAKVRTFDQLRWLAPRAFGLAALGWQRQLRARLRRNAASDG